VITKISGMLVALTQERATIRAGAFEYEVLIPEFSRRQLQQDLGHEVSLNTLHYFDGNLGQGRITPRLVGFLTEVEREFFELFCSVDGVGAKKALRAMVRPVQEVASAIEEQDAKGLSNLPGIGPATAERIIAKLRRKVPKFALLISQDTPDRQADVASDIVTETFEVLLTLGHGEAEARRLIDAALMAKKKYKNVETLLHAVYEQTQNS
jgi:holliday junction DNA helicase RuvA